MCIFYSLKRTPPSPNRIIVTTKKTIIGEQDLMLVLVEMRHPGKELIIQYSIVPSASTFSHVLGIVKSYWAVP